MDHSPVEPKPHLPCPVCGHAESTFLFNGYDRMHGFAGEFPIHRCNHCQVVFLAKRFTADELTSFYPETYYSYQEDVPAPQISALKAWELQLRKETEAVVLSRYLGYPGPDSPSLLARVNARLKRKKYMQLPHYQPQGRLLDVGCGSGDFLLKMKELGWEVYGVEPGQEGARVGQQRGLDIFPGTLEQARFPDSHFDFIRFEHVLEHVPDPVATLREAKRILRPGGQIRLMVPNWNSWPARWFKSYWYHLDTPRHLFWFGPDTLAFTAAQAGLSMANLHIRPDYSDIADSLIYLLKDSMPNVAANLKQRKGLWKLCNKLCWPVRLGMRIFGAGSLLQANLTHYGIDDTD